MKRILLLLTLLAVNLPTWAQVSEQFATMSQGSNNALSMQLDGVDVKTAEKVWSKYVKDFKGKAKKDRKTGEWMVDDLTIPSISPNTIDVYATFEESGTGVSTRVWMDLGGAFLASNTHADRFSKAIEFMDGFGLEIEIESIKQRLDGEEGALKGLEKELEGFLRDQKSEEENIARYEEKIRESEQKIQESIQQQGIKSTEIESQKATIEATKAELKSLERMN